MRFVIGKRPINDLSKGVMITLLLVFITYIFLCASFNFPPAYELLVLVNSTICIWNMVNIKHEPYSLRMMVNVFIYIFFILANAIQFGNHNNVLTFQFPLTEFDFIFFQYVLFFILIIFNSVYTYLKPSRIPVVGQRKMNPNKSVIISVITTFIVLAYFRFNIFSLLARGFVESLTSGSGGGGGGGIDTSQSWAGYLIFDHFIRPIPWAIFLLNLLTGGMSKKTNLLLFFCALITVFPTGLARNAAAMYWLPIFIVYFRKWIKGRIFIWFIFFGLFFVFPFLDNFRYFDGTIKLNLGGLDYLDNMNFDASQIFMALLSIGFITYGKQLSGALLFFVPRSFWASKPIGSGATLVEQMKGDFFNVSMPFFAEGYINLGYLGIIIFTLFLAWFSKKFDTLYWNSKNHGGIFQGYYLILLGAIIFIMRGDLMSSFAYTLGLLVCYFVVTRLTLIRPQVSDQTNAASL